MKSARVGTEGRKLQKNFGEQRQDLDCNLRAWWCREGDPKKSGMVMPLELLAHILQLFGEEPKFV